MSPSDTLKDEIDVALGNIKSTRQLSIGRTFTPHMPNLQHFTTGQLRAASLLAQLFRAVGGHSCCVLFVCFPQKIRQPIVGAFSIDMRTDTPIGPKPNKRQKRQFMDGLSDYLFTGRDKSNFDISVLVIGRFQDAPIMVRMPSTTTATDSSKGGCLIAIISRDVLPNFHQPLYHSGLKT